MNHRLRAILAAMTVAVGGCGDDSGGMLGTLERDRIELVAEAQETIVEVAVREGAAVTEGQLLLRLDPSSAAARLSQARANALQAERRHAETVAGARKEQVSEARAIVAGAGARASDRVERVRSRPESRRRWPVARKRPRPPARVEGQRNRG